jgi:hypothetical protein
MLPGFGAAESELSFYFGEGDRLLGGHSSMGPMLDYAALYYVPRELRAALENVTVWHHPARPPTDQYVPNDDALRRFGRVGRRLRDAATRWPDAPAILAAYFGAEGDRFGRLPCGRTGALLRFTSAGLKMIERQRTKERGAKLKVTDAMRAENAAAQNANALLGQAMVEARAQLVRAIEAYTGRSVYQEAAE